MNNDKIKDAIDKPMKIALYMGLEYGTIMPWEYVRATHDKHYNQLPDGQTEERPMTGYVRISEPIDASWRGANEESMIQNAMSALDQEAIKIRNEMQLRLDKIEERRSQLLAITYQAVDHE